MAAKETQRHLALPLLYVAAFYLDGADHQRLPFLANTAAQAGCSAVLLAWNDVRYHTRQRQPVADLVTANRLAVTVDSLGPNAEPHVSVALAPLFPSVPMPCCLAYRWGASSRHCGRR